MCNIYNRVKQKRRRNGELTLPTTLLACLLAPSPSPSSSFVIFIVSQRNHDEQVMGNQHMKDFDKAFDKQKRRTLRDFQRATGLTLPSDNQI